MSIATWLFGPLVWLECRRSVGRGWLILVRTLAALAVMGATMIVLWVWWFWSMSDPNYRPYAMLRQGLAIVEGMVLTAAVLLAPAVLAGSLAGDKERGALGLLLTTRVSPREIVTGRLVGKLAQVVMVLLAGLPAIVLFASLAGMSLRVVATLVVLPAAVALGGGGLATAVSAVSRRGREALLSVYLVDLLTFLGPIAWSLGLSHDVFEWLASLSPYHGLESLVWQEDVKAAVVTIASWTTIGLVGIAFASWRLVPSSLKQLDGDRTGRSTARWRRIPAVDETRPMLWKELYIERAGKLGGAGWWIGAALTLLLGGGSLFLGAVVAWEGFRGGNLAWFEWAQSTLSIVVGGSGRYLGWLIEWAIGLRAAVTIASERERGTWDAILTSPLESREIIWAKLWGSVHALRWLFVAAFLSWTIAAASEAIDIDRYLNCVFGTLCCGTFMAAVGLRSSLACATATRAMAVTIGIWLGAQVVFQLLAAIILTTVRISLILAAIAATGTLTPAAIAGMNSMLVVTWLVALNASYVVATLIMVSYTRVLFDRLAGRRAGGALSVAAEELLHGAPVIRRPVEVGLATPRAQPEMAVLGPGETPEPPTLE